MGASPEPEPAPRRAVSRDRYSPVAAFDGRAVDVECARLSEQIDEARARVQPRLEPRVDVVEYEIGDASLFVDEGVATSEDRTRIRVRNKLLVRRLLDAVLIFDDGSVYTQFATESLFGPALGVHGPSGAVPPSGATLGSARRATHQDRLHAELNAYEGEGTGGCSP